MTYPVKPSGEVRPCLDVRYLNKAIMCENHKPQTVEELPISWLEQWSSQRKTPWRHSYRYISQKKAPNYWWSTHTKAGTGSSRCHLGPRCPKTFLQMKMDLIMEKCPGVISIHNDIAIYGTSDQDHYANLINLTSLTWWMWPSLKAMFWIARNWNWKSLKCTWRTLCHIWMPPRGALVCA